MVTSMPGVTSVPRVSLLTPGQLSTSRSILVNSSSSTRFLRLNRDRFAGLAAVEPKSAGVDAEAADPRRIDADQLRGEVGHDRSTAGWQGLGPPPNRDHARRPGVGRYQIV